MHLSWSLEVFNMYLEIFSLYLAIPMDKNEEQTKEYFVCIITFNKSVRVNKGKGEGVGTSR